MSDLTVIDNNKASFLGGYGVSRKVPPEVIVTSNGYGGTGKPITDGIVIKKDYSATTASSAGLTGGKQGKINGEAVGDTSKKTTTNFALFKNGSPEVNIFGTNLYLQQPFDAFGNVPGVVLTTTEATPDLAVTYTSKNSKGNLPLNLDAGAVYIRERVNQVGGVPLAGNDATTGIRRGSPFLASLERHFVHDNFIEVADTAPTAGNSIPGFSNDTFLGVTRSVDPTGGELNKLTVSAWLTNFKGLTLQQSQTPVTRDFSISELTPVGLGFTPNFITTGFDMSGTIATGPSIAGPAKFLQTIQLSYILGQGNETVGEILNYVICFAELRGSALNFSVLPTIVQLGVPGLLTLTQGPMNDAITDLPLTTVPNTNRSFMPGWTGVARQLTNSATVGGILTNIVVFTATAGAGKPIVNSGTDLRVWNDATGSIILRGGISYKAFPIIKGNTSCANNSIVRVLSFISPIPLTSPNNWKLSMYSSIDAFQNVVPGAYQEVDVVLPSGTSIPSCFPKAYDFAEVRGTDDSEQDIFVVYTAPSAGWSDSGTCFDLKINYVNFDTNDSTEAAYPPRELTTITSFTLNSEYGDRSSVGSVTINNLTAPGTGYENNIVYDVIGGSGKNLKVRVLGVGGVGDILTFQTIAWGEGYTAGDVVTINGGGLDAQLTIVSTDRSGNIDGFIENRMMLSIKPVYQYDLDPIGVSFGCRTGLIKLIVAYNDTFGQNIATSSYFNPKSIDLNIKWQIERVASLAKNDREAARFQVENNFSANKCLCYSNYLRNINGTVTREPSSLRTTPNQPEGLMVSYPVLETFKTEVAPSLVLQEELQQTLGIQIAQSSRNFSSFWNLPPSIRQDVIVTTEDLPIAPSFDLGEAVNEAIAKYAQTIPPRLSVQYLEGYQAISGAFKNSSIITSINYAPILPRDYFYFDSLLINTSQLPSAWSRSALGNCVLPESDQTTDPGPFLVLPAVIKPTGYMSRYKFADYLAPLTTGVSSVNYAPSLAIDSLQPYSVFGASYAVTSIFGESEQYVNEDNEFIRDAGIHNRFLTFKTFSEAEITNETFLESTIATANVSSQVTVKAVVERPITRDEFLGTIENSGFSEPPKNGKRSQLSDPTINAFNKRGYYVPGGPVNNYAATKGLLVSTMLDGVATRKAEPSSTITTLNPAALGGITAGLKARGILDNEVLGSVALGENLWLTGLWGSLGPPVSISGHGNFGTIGLTSGNPNVLNNGSAGFPNVQLSEAAIPLPFPSNNGITGANASNQQIWGSRPFSTGPFALFSKLSTTTNQPNAPRPAPLVGKPVLSNGTSQFPNYSTAGITNSAAAALKNLNLGTAPIGQKTTTSGFGTASFGPTTTVFDATTGQYKSIAPATATPIIIAPQSANDVQANNLNGLVPRGKLSENSGLILRVNKDINPLFSRPGTYLQGVSTMTNYENI